jgi:diacylglycerol kinase family enzyme
MTGIPYRMNDVTFHTARRVRLTSSDGRSVPLQMDGDPAGHLPAEVDVVPGGVRVITP